MNDIIALRIEAELLKELDKIGKEISADRSTVLRELIKRGLKEFLKERAAEMYREGKITLSGAAHSAGLTLWEMERYLVNRGFKSEYSTEDLEKEMKLLSKK